MTTAAHAEPLRLSTRRRPTQAVHELPGNPSEGASCIRTLTLTLLAAVVVAAPAEARPRSGWDRCHHQACVERVAMHQCSQTRPVPCILRAALHWRVSFPMLVRKARCESRLDPLAHNPSGATGLFQFMPTTFATSPYRWHSPWSAKWSSLAAGWAHHVGRGGEWSCS